MDEIYPGYKFAVEVLLPLNHDRYKSYFYQFSLLELGLFTAMNLKMKQQSLLKKALKISQQLLSDRIRLQSLSL